MRSNVKQKDQANTDTTSIEDKLAVIIKLLAAIYVKGSANDTEAIVKLGFLRLSAGQISEVVGVSSHHASQIIYANKKSARKKSTRGVYKK